MIQPEKKKGQYFIPARMMLVLGVVLSAIVIATSAFRRGEAAAGPSPTRFADKDSIASVEAFKQVYTVLMSPRCLNCHPAGDVPLQGDDSHVHIMLPKRGKDGKGILAMKCANCHQAENTPGLHTPPGNPNWHLPPADMKMVFEGRTPRQLALQLMDPNKNGHKNMAQLLEHASDGLVQAGWNMGEGRTKPPMSYEDFVTAWKTWLNKGGFAPAD